MTDNSSSPRPEEPQPGPVPPSYIPPGYGPGAGGPYTPAGAAGPVPLWAPLYGASLPQAVRRFFLKYARFDGRASRSEFWWWVLTDSVVYIVLWVLFVVLGIATGRPEGDGSIALGPLAFLPGALVVIWFLGTIVPNIAVTVRRLHDANLAGWFILLCLIPSVGGIIVLVFTLLSPNPAGARFDQPQPEPVGGRG